MTPRQLELKEAHGTPEEFEQALVKALGEISATEAIVAAMAYRAEWREAGREMAETPQNP